MIGFHGFQFRFSSLGTRTLFHVSGVNSHGSLTFAWIIMSNVRDPEIIIRQGTSAEAPINRKAFYGEQKVHYFMVIQVNV